ncbi:MAG: DUF4157 domain-containing protein [Myxococcota bacterium]
MADRSAAGEGLSERLSKRGAGGLARRRIGDVDVYQGDVGDKTLGALRARAITVDRKIIVNQRFDARNPEDAALLAHEDEHRRGSGGAGGGATGHSDAEEKRARFAESMTHDLTAAGVPIEQVLHDLKSGSSAAAMLGGDTPAAELMAAVLGPDAATDPMAAYRQLRAEGQPHAQIVAELARHVMDTLDHLNHEHAARTGEADFFK